MAESSAVVAMPSDDPGSHGIAEAAIEDQQLPGALKILMLEDEPTDAKLITRELRKARLIFTARRVDAWADFIDALETFAPDVLLADCKLPGFSGAEALAHVRHVHPEIPVVIVTGTLGDEAAIELLTAGAKDYVLKSNLVRLPSAVERAIAIEQGIRARKAAERAVHESEERFRAFTAAAPNAIIVIDASSTVSYWNPQAEQMLGYTAEEAVGRKIHQWLVPERFRAAHEAGIRAFAKTGQGPMIGETVELAALHKSGTEIPIELSLNALRVGAEWHAIGILRDITERKEAEAALRESKQLIEGILNAIPVRVFWKDKNLVYLGCNAEFARDAGFAAPEDIVGKDDYQMGWRDQAELYRSDDRQVIESGRPKLLIEEHLTTRNGEIITILTNKMPLRGANREISGVLGTYQDITERKRTEERIREDEAKFRSLVEQNVAGVVIVRNDGTIGYINPYFAGIIGYTQAEATGREFFDFIPETEQPIVAKELQGHFSGTGGFLQLETAMLGRNGSTVDVIVNASPTIFEGRPASIGVVLDITERKRTEATIREDEAKFRSLVEQNIAGIIIIGPDGKISYINPYWARLNGYTSEETIGHSVLEYIPDAEKQRVSQELGKQLGGAGGFVQIATSMLTKDGRTIDILVNASPATYQGKPASIAVLLDVTERNKAQRELASTAAILATEHELSPDAILVVDRAAKIISINRRFAEIFEVTAELLADKTDEPLLHWVVGQVADSAAFLARVRYLYDHPEETSAEEIALKDGRILDRYSAPMNRAGGEYAGRIWFFRDITQRKRAEEALRTSEERLRLVIENAPDAILLYDVDQDHLISANKAAEHLFGLPRDKIVEYGPRHFYVPDQPDAQAVAQSFDKYGNRALAGEKVIFERRIRNALGQERLCQVALVGMPSPGQRLLRASFVDITEQKAAERALRRLNRTLRTLSRGNEVLVHAPSEARLLSEMCHVIVETGGYRMAWVGIAEQDAAKSVTPVAWAGETGQYLATAQITWADEPRGRGPHGRAIRSGDRQVTQDLTADPSIAPWQEAVRERGFGSSATFPLKDAAGVFAVLTIDAAETGAFDADEVKLLQELADDLAFGIMALRDRRAHETLGQRWQRSLEATVGAIANTVEMRDPYTAGHQQRVAKLATAMARELHMSEQQIQGLYLAGIIHDVGKIDIPAEILNKPGKLSKLQFQLIQGHPQAGYDIVKGVDFPWPIAEMVRQHHERLDGSGYPRGLRDAAILAEAKILAVADVVEAMMSHRPYRAALGIEAALAEIEKGKDRIYDPAAVDACIALFRDRGFSLDGAPPAGA